MTKKSKPTFSFYQFLFDDTFTSQLRLPPQFMKDHGKKLSENVKLYVESEEHSWIVKIERVGLSHFFTDGWTRFARDVDLKIRDFLLFQLVDKSTFEVTVYDISGCEKDLCSVPRTHAQADDQIKQGFTNDKPDKSLVKKLTKDDASELEIPGYLAMSTGIVRKKKLKLRYGKKWKKWDIHISVKKCGKIAITGGWNEFLTGNKLVIGSMISLEFVGDVIKAKVLKKDDNGEMFGSVKKKRGRPHKFPCS